jgi:hypothetical protein
MKAIRIIPALLAGAALLAPAGCERSSVTELEIEQAAVDLAQGTVAGTPGPDDAGVGVPITLRLATRWSVPGASAAECPDLIDPGTGELFTAAGVGEGHANHMGRVQFRGEHPTINLCSILDNLPPAPEDVMRTGRMEIVAADGSTATGTYRFLLAPPELGGFMTLNVDGGTGRFRGASGQLDLNWEKSGGMDCGQDPLCLEEAKMHTYFEGSLSLPRPIAVSSR